MVDLDKKYQNDTLTPDELRKYKNRVNAESVPEKESRLFQIWMDSDYPQVPTANALSVIKRDIDLANRQGRRTMPPIQRILQYAAAVLFILLAASTIWLYQSKQTIEKHEVRFATASGEKANVTLPDGTIVNLNEESAITYKIAAFNRKNRQISFDGEGYFDVAKQDSRPFVIRTRNINVFVTGTKFFLIDREKLQQSEIILDEGQVCLHSMLADCDIVLEAGQKATLDFTTSRFIITESHQSGKAHFSRTRLSFNDAPFEEVINQLSEIYHIKIHVQSNHFTHDNFTGYLPSTNMNEAFDILSRAYHLNVTLEGGIFILAAK